MKALLPVKRLLLLPVFTGLALLGDAQNNTAFCDHLHDVLNRLTQLHYDPVAVNEQVKKEMVAIYIGDLDPRTRFFSAEDTETIKNTAARDGLCQTYLLSEDLYQKRLRQHDSLVKVILSKPIDFTVNEQVTLGIKGEKKRFSETERKVFLTRQLKYKMLDMVYHKLTDDSTDLKKVKKLSSALEKEIREKLLAREQIFAKRLHAGNTPTRLSEIFLNAIAKRYDPHSSYFPEQTKNEFEESLSKDNRSFGLVLAENENYEIEVTDIVPGSPAWISNQVHGEEILESVTDKRGVTFDLLYMGMEYLTNILRDPVNEQLTFHLRNRNNEKIMVTLIKARIDNIENSFRGYLLADNETRLGYVPLPSFYTDFESDQALGCANDVAKEILLLKKENIQGLILDLRNNGGGSLKEAIEIAGLFIDEGPVGALKMKEGKPVLLKDFNRGTVYDGPLIIMVNGLSASASEFLSGCLQDYGRAVVTGTETYGKGTAQSVYPVDTMASVSNVYANTFIKVTNGKFYRVSRGSNQAAGIRPDIRIPDLYTALEFFKEKSEPYHLANDSVAKKMYYKKQETGLTPVVRGKRQQAIAQDSTLQAVTRLSDSLNTMLTTGKNIPLEFTAFLFYKEEENKFYERLGNVYDNKTAIFKVQNHTFAEQLLQLNVDEKVFNEQVMDELYYDPVLTQTFLIAREIIQKK